MISYAFKLFLTLNSVLLSLVIFLVKENSNNSHIIPILSKLPHFVSYIFYLLVVLLFTYLSISFSKYLGTDTLDGDSISVIEPANDAFLPSYLGYFFVALSVPNLETFSVVFGVICIFIFYSRISYFNPMFFLFKFNFYYVVNNKNIKVLLITRKQLKDSKNSTFSTLKRINNYTFIDMESNK
jgi:hypothetical protein